VAMRAYPAVPMRVESRIRRDLDRHAVGTRRSASTGTLLGTSDRGSGEHEYGRFDEGQEPDNSQSHQTPRSEPGGRFAPNLQ
jgi:hypothetical protein